MVPQYFSYDLSKKFEALEETRVATIAENTDKSAKADAEEKRIKDFEAQLKQSEERRELLTQAFPRFKPRVPDSLPIWRSLEKT